MDTDSTYCYYCRTPLIWTLVIQISNYPDQLGPSDKCFLTVILISKNLKIKIYRTIILPVVLYGCETWSLTLREERRLRVFENRVLRKVFEPRRDEVTGE